MTADNFYPIGTAGHPWGEQERAEWRAQQRRRRNYGNDVEARIVALSDRFEKTAYGQLDYANDSYMLHALRSRSVTPGLPTVLITGGVHGYETSGVFGALDFLEQCAEDYAGKTNLVVMPCVSPWSYERISRWNFDAVDPNRNFCSDSPSREATTLMQFVNSVSDNYLLHIDLHETTDSDENEFRPALSSRDGTNFKRETIPDGFYLVADSEDRQLAFQEAIISKVSSVTHIAAADAMAHIIGSPVIARGIIEYPAAKLALCMSITTARFRTTTEVYPDSIKSTPDICVRAQVAAVSAALDSALNHA